MTEQMSAFDPKRTFTTSVTCCPARVSGHFLTWLQSNKDFRGIVPLYDVTAFSPLAPGQIHDLISVKTTHSLDLACEHANGSFL